MPAPAVARGPAANSPTRRRAPRPLLVAGIACLVPPLIGTVLRLVPPRDDATALLASFIPYALLGYVVAAVVSAVALVWPRRRVAAVLTLVSLLGLSLHTAWTVPFFVPDGRVAASPTFTLLSLNLYKGRADPDQLVAQGSAADVVVLVEATPDALADLAARGWLDRFPYAAGGADGVQSDTAVYSRYPLRDSELLGTTSFQQWVTTVETPDAGAVRLMAVHPCNPYCGRGLWASEHAALARVAAANLDQPLVVAGDFNAVDDHGPMLDLHRLGLESATDLVGAGWLPTYPANRPFPPLLPIDHVLVDDQLTATSIRRVRVAGTDHLGLLTTLARAG
ncbi:endonuclease/exonuclease/phosphatase family protein [uncultured Friedmanniella sp.]|uniref:endonuclease/exonuclease/phosphatase family protein n=1 Tax=uncultured Friedmanniella sp. TaxID=335381 RepID=UPI0035CB2143